MRGGGSTQRPNFGVWAGVNIFALALIMYFASSSSEPPCAPMPAATKAVPRASAEIVREVIKIVQQEAAPPLPVQQVAAGSKYPRIAECRAIAPEESLADCTHEADYVARWATLRPNHNWTIVDIGSNKGFNIADFLAAIGVPGFNRQELMKHIIEYAKSINLTKTVRRQLCGTCFGCMGDSPAPKQDTVFLGFQGSKPLDFRVYGVDPIVAHIENLRRAFPDPTHFQFVLGVGSDAAGAPIPFVQFPFGEEAGSISSASSLPTRDVQQIVVDRWLPDIEYVDMLLTDTEGHDLIVAEGAKRLLFEGRVGLYIFEMNAAKRIETFGSFLQKLDHHGYSCYAAIGNGPYGRSLAPINGACWRDRYATIRFMNVMCANRKFPDLVDIMEHWTHNFKPIDRHSEETMRNAKPSWDVAWMFEP